MKNIPIFTNTFLKRIKIESNAGCRIKVKRTTIIK